MGDLKNEKTEILISELQNNEYFLFNSFIRFLTADTFHPDWLNEFNKCIQRQSMLWCELARLNCDVYKTTFKNIQESGGGFSVFKLLLFIENSITTLKQNQQVNEVINLGDETVAPLFFQKTHLGVKSFILSEYKKWLVFLFSFFTSRFNSFRERPWLEFLKTNNLSAQAFSTERGEELVVLFDLIKRTFVVFFHPYITVLSSDLKENESLDSFIAVSAAEILENRSFVEEILCVSKQVESKANAGFFLKKLPVFGGNVVLIQKLEFSNNEYSQEIAVLLSQVNLRALELYVVFRLFGLKEGENMLPREFFFNVFGEINNFLDKYFNECQNLRKLSVSMYRNFIGSSSNPNSLYHIFAFIVWAKHVKPTEANDQAKTLFVSNIKTYKLQFLPTDIYILSISVILEVLVRFFFQWLLYLERHERFAKLIASSEKDKNYMLVVETLIIRAVRLCLNWVFDYLATPEEIKKIIEWAFYSKNFESIVSQFPIIEGMHVQLKDQGELKFQYNYTFSH